MTEPAPTIQVLPFPVRVVRWWQKTTILFQLWSLIELFLPILLLTDFTSLGFSAKAAAWIMLAVKLINVSSSITLSNKSSSIVGNKAEVATADAAPAPIPAPQLDEVHQ